MDTLDMEIGGELAQNLYRLYEYLYDVLGKANIKKDVDKIDEVLKHLRELRETWQKAITISNSEKSESLIEDSVDKYSKDNDDDEYEDDDEDYEYQDGE